MATLYLRDLPVPLYERLRGRITQRLAELVNERSLPPDAPKPEDIIREFRDASPR
jgi:hypothetical protein